MLPDDTRKRIKNITAGIIIERIPDTCTTIRNLLSASFETSTTVKIDFESKSIIKEEQAKLIDNYSYQHDLWVTDIPSEDRFLTRGGEARIYLDNDGKNVIKVNDAVYYATWLEFFNSILLHNLIFPNTAYTLMGLILEDMHDENVLVNSNTLFFIDTVFYTIST
jgi:hypothetical protein